MLLLLLDSLTASKRDTISLESTFLRYMITADIPALRLDWQIALGRSWDLCLNLESESILSEHIDLISPNLHESK